MSSKRQGKMQHFTLPQMVGQINTDRSQHVWTEHSKGFKCVICGCVAEKPETAKTEWLTYEPLTEEEKLLCPFIEIVK